MLSLTPGRPLLMGIVNVTPDSFSADDYLVKPFAPEELAARLRAVCRRSAGAAGARVAFGDVVVGLAARCAWRGGERVQLGHV